MLDTKTYFRTLHGKVFLGKYRVQLFREFYKDNVVVKTQEENIINWGYIWFDLKGLFGFSFARVAIATASIVAALMDRHLPLFMGAIAFDATANANGTSASLTFSHTCTGSNRFLCVNAQTEDLQSNATTYAGVDMTNSARTTNTAINTMFTLIAPASGANNVVVKQDSSSPAAGCAVSFNGAAQSSNPEATNTATGTSTAPSVSVTTVTNNAFVVDGCASNDIDGITADASQTSRAAFTWSSTRSFGCSTEQSATPASVTMSWTSSNSQWGMVGVAVAEFATATFIPKVIIF